MFFSLLQAYSSKNSGHFDPLMKFPSALRLRRNRLNPKRVKSCEEVFARLRTEGLSADDLYAAIVDQVKYK